MATELAISTGLEEAVTLTANYRGASAFSGFVKGFLIESDTIAELMSQNNGNINGIRVYLGIDISEQPARLKALAVATEGDEFNDFGIPESGAETTAIIAEPRPCPEHCGKMNVLNS